jgi:hypothetical protein
MNRLLHLVQDIRRKISNEEYKTIVDEIRADEIRAEANSLSKVKIAVPWVCKGLDRTDECGEDPITITHEFFTLIVPTTYLQQNNVTPGSSYQITELFNNSLNYDSDSFINRLETVVINSVQIQNRTCIIISSESLNKNNDSVDFPMEVS